MDRNKVLIMVLVFVFLSSLQTSEASFLIHRPVNQIIQELEKSLETMETALSEETLNDGIAMSDDNSSLVCVSPQQERFFFTSFWMSFGLDFIIKIPLASFRVTPYFGFTWTRKYPPGWKLYEP